MLFVLEGVLAIEAAYGRHEISAGDFLIFSSARPTSSPMAAAARRGSSATSCFEPGVEAPAEACAPAGRLQKPTFTARSGFAFASASSRPRISPARAVSR